MTIQRFFLLSLIIPLLWVRPALSLESQNSFSLNLWPLLQYRSDPVEGMQEMDGLGPIFSWRRSPVKKEWGFRPLFFWVERSEESLSQLEFLYPFGKIRNEEGYTKGYFSPLSLYWREQGEGRKKWDFHFFPFFIGETEKGENYFGLFPIYGRLLERYGKHEIRFLLWPIYGESSSEGFRTTHLLWPFFSFTQGEKKGGFHFWPFYGRKEEFGVTRKQFILWPFFIQQKKDMDTDDPMEEWMVFPFYISKESKRFESKTFLWPFFSHARDRLTGFEQWDFPFPFYQSLKGEDLKGYRFFPFYGYKVKGKEWRRTFYLYPLYQLEEDWMGESQERTHRILLLIRIRSNEMENGLKKSRSLRIWPFFDYEEDEEGRLFFSVFYLFPFKDEGFERNLSPLFRIFRWERDSRKGSSVNFLWGFYRKTKKEDKESWEIAHLLGMEKEPRKKTVTVLKGLFVYKKDGDRSLFRLFYLPIRLKKAERPPLQEEESIGGLSNQEKGEKIISGKQKEFSNAQEDRDTGDRFVFTGEGPYQF